MRSSAFISILFLFFIAKIGYSFTFQSCQNMNPDGYPPYQCNDEIYVEDQFTYDFINNMEQKFFVINVVNESELTLNFDGFRYDKEFYINTSIDTKLKIQTSEWNTTHGDSSYADYNSKIEVYAPNCDVTIENINESVTEDLIVFTNLRFKSISSSDPDKPLHLVSTSNSFSFDINSFHDSTFYANQIKLNLPHEIQQSSTIILKPAQKVGSNDIKDDIEISLTSSSDLTIIYGKSQIKVEYPDKKTITLITTSKKTKCELYVSGNAIITCEDGLTEDDLIVPIINSNYDVNHTKLPLIIGNWPTIKKIKTDKEKLENGYTIRRFYRESTISGTINFAANSFPFYDFPSKLELILTTSKSSISLLYQIYNNVTISTKEDTETYFYINGIPSETEYYRNEYDDGSIREFLCAILTNSSKLKIIANTKREFNIIGPAQISYKIIDNSEKEVNKNLAFNQGGGTIVLPFGIDFNDYSEQLLDIINDYKNKNPQPKEGNLSETINYFINLAKNKITDLSDILNNVANQVKPINISLENDPENPDKKNNFILNRNEIPLASLYVNSLNRLDKAICIENGTIDLSKWSFKDAENMIKSFFGDDDNIDDIMTYMIPKITNGLITSNIQKTKDDKCIGFQLTSMPSSTIELFIYTTNTTFIEILDKINLLTVLSSDLDASSKLKNPNSKTIVILVLDDIPDGKSINLNGIRNDANVILIGFKQEKLEDVYQVVQSYIDLENEYDYNPDGNWNETEYDILKEIKKTKQIELLNGLSSHYTDYQPKASITYNTVESLLLISVNYAGTHIKCTNFYPLASTFSNLNALANDFSAKKTITETLTHKLISNLKFNDLVLFPISNNPINMMGVEEINFTQSKWTLKLHAFLNDDGFVNDEIVYYPIETSKVEGHLYLYSLNSNCDFIVPEASEKQVLKGISINLNYVNTEYPKIKEIPGIIQLEDNPSVNEKDQHKISNKEVITKIIKRIYPFLAIPSAIKASPKSSLSANTRRSTKRIHPLDSYIEEIEKAKVNFNGNWKNVESIGPIEINTGDLITAIEAIPSVVVPIIQVKCDRSITLDTQAEEISFTQPLSVIHPISVSITNENAKVSFSDIKFDGEYAEISLLIGGKPSKVAVKNVVVDKKSSAKFSGEVEIANSLELGPGSSLVANSISAKNIALKLNYRLSGGIANIPKGVEPNSIIFNYIGELARDTEIVDYSDYLGSTNNSLTFTGEGHKDKCQQMKNIARFESETYPEFRDKESVVELVCIENQESTVLAINVTRIPTGETEKPPVIEPTGGDDNKSPTEPPVPTDIPSPPADDETKKDNIDAGKVEIKTDEEPDKIKENIENKFKNESLPTDTKADQVLTIVSNNKPIEFKNLSLESHQYVKVENNTNVKLTSGTLNLVLDNVSSNVNIKIDNDNSDVKLSIKNMDTCTIKIESDSDEKKKISITSTSEVYGPLTFEVGEKVESLEIKSINLHDSGSISSTVPVTVNNLVAQPQTTGKLKSVKVSKEFSISQSAVLELENVSLNSAIINLNLHSYNASSYNTPMLKGDLGEPPSSISLVKPKNDNSSPQNDHKYLLFRGNFLTTCNDWMNSISFDGVPFNSRSCDDYDNLRILNERKSLNVFVNPKKGDNQGDDGKLSAGQIAGIVVGCVLGVALIVGIVVFIVIKKRKNRDQSSDESAGAQDDL